MFRFKCATCNEWHEGLPAIGFAAPDLYETIPDEERLTRCVLTSDLCIVDDVNFFVLGRLEIRVESEPLPFAWLLWVSLGEASFDEYERHYDVDRRSHIGPYPCRIAVNLPFYPKTSGLAAKLHACNDFQRPLIVMEGRNHTLAREQSRGITIDRMAKFAAACFHGPD